MRDSHRIYELLEDARRRVLQHRWRSPAVRVEVAELEAELFSYETALLEGRPLPDLDAVEGLLVGLPS